MIVLDGCFADVGERDGVGKNKALVGFVGLLVQVIDLGGDIDAVFVIVVHGAISQHFSGYGKQSIQLVEMVNPARGGVYRV